MSRRTLSGSASPTLAGSVAAAAASGADKARTTVMNERRVDLFRLKAEATAVSILMEATAVCVLMAALSELQESECGVE